MESLVILSPLVARSILQPLMSLSSHGPAWESSTGHHVIRITEQRGAQTCVRKDFSKLGTITFLLFPSPLFLF